MPDMIRLDIDIINIRFEYSDTDTVSDVGPVRLEEFWRNLNESGGIYERKTLFQMKKEAQAGFKGTRTGPPCRTRDEKKLLKKSWILIGFSLAHRAREDEHHIHSHAWLVLTPLHWAQQNHWRLASPSTNQQPLVQRQEWFPVSRRPPNNFFISQMIHKVYLSLGKLHFPTLNWKNSNFEKS